MQNVLKLIFSLLAISFFFTSCFQEEPEEWSVKHAGSLKNIMENNDLSAHVDLDTLSDLSNLYAVGALEGLKGEVIIIDGKPLIIKVDNEDDDNDYTIDNSFDHKAVFLAYAQITEWQEIEIPVEVKTKYDLKRFLKKQAKGRGIPENKAFPFLIEGMISSFTWHIIDWDESDSVHTHEKHKKSGLYHGKIEEMVQLVGFHSEKHHGIFTHQSSDVHMHVVYKDHSFGAHLDDCILGEGMILKIPK